MKNLEKTYNPKDFEKIYDSWLEDKDFVARVNPDKVFVYYCYATSKCNR